MSNDWHKSSYSSSGSQCVEVREHTSGVDVRDTVHREAGHIEYSADSWASFLRGVKTSAV
jgi:hypothetical protein